MGGRRGKTLVSKKTAQVVDEPVAIVERIRARGSAGVRASDILALLYHHELNCSITSLVGAGWTAKLGDPTNGVVAEQGNFRTVDEAAQWLLEEARRRHKEI